MDYERWKKLREVEVLDEKNNNVTIDNEIAETSTSEVFPRSKNISADTLAAEYSRASLIEPSRAELNHGRGMHATRRRTQTRDHFDRLIAASETRLDHLETKHRNTLMYFYNSSLPWARGCVAAGGAVDTRPLETGPIPAFTTLGLAGHGASARVDLLCCYSRGIKKMNAKQKSKISVMRGPGSGRSKRKVTSDEREGQRVGSGRSESERMDEGTESPDSVGIDENFSFLPTTYGNKLFWTNASLNSQVIGVKKADPKELYNIFLQYATVEKNGEKFITNENFIRKFLALFDEDDYNNESVALFATIMDTNKDGLISFSEFQAFENLLCSPDALYRTAFQLFRRHENDYVTYEDFVGIIERSIYQQTLPFDLDSTFIHLYFGQNKSEVLKYHEFCQFLHDYNNEYSLEAFRRYNKDGFIEVGDFKNIMLTVKQHLLTDALRSKVLNSKRFLQDKHKISFSYYMAFISLLYHMELFKRVYLYATKGDKKRPVTKDQFLHSAQMMSQITPLEINILYSLCDIIYQIDGKLLYKHLKEITPEQYYRRVKQSITEIKAVSSPDERGIFIQILESAYRFFIGGIAGGLGAAAVYPIDLVKTRMQNQRIQQKGDAIYANSIDCFKKVLQYEGARGLYRGVVPQVCGVVPEKALKLCVNDFIRDKMTDKNGKLSLFGEILAGASAGTSQILISNPLEIVKIRLQVAGESGAKSKITTMSVVRDLGFFGLYKGSTACALRDAPFSAIYFPAYTYLKAKFADDSGYNHPVTLLVAGAAAGLPSAALVTPMDVIKTRLQVVPKKGQTVYNGIIDASKKIYTEEGFKAFWKGTLARICRSSPQFGVTLAAYEVLQRLFYIDFGGSRPSGSELRVLSPVQETKKKAHHIGGYQVAIPVLTGLETKFGISLPRFSHPKPQ
ncbi:unnamed protein product [Diatraea saccharalis]|uniref:EF-hand domain-containing protein n=1 Tax=Diatraea saccharalis TaxID=40085 RepID=A0A9N9REM5_9NEOP|nr:unnamed protein product [Diatraea saccharalis]